MDQNFRNREESDLENTLKMLDEENQAMRGFFDQLALTVLKKTIRKIEKQLRHFPPEVKLFGDDSPLIFFEEVCVMQQEGSMEFYPLVEDTIVSCCESAYEDLTPDEKFILNHQTISTDGQGYEIIQDEFFRYCENYENQRIRNSLEKRFYYDDY